MSRTGSPPLADITYTSSLPSYCAVNAISFPSGESARESLLSLVGGEPQGHAAGDGHLPEVALGREHDRTAANGRIAVEAVGRPHRSRQLGATPRMSKPRAGRRARRRDGGRDPCSLPVGDDAPASSTPAAAAAQGFKPLDALLDPIPGRGCPTPSTSDTPTACGSGST